MTNEELLSQDNLLWTHEGRKRILVLMQRARREALQEAVLAANAILGPMTAEFGRVMEKAPREKITITYRSHSIALAAEKFMALYRATDTS